MTVYVEEVCTYIYTSSKLHSDRHFKMVCVYFYPCDGTIGSLGCTKLNKVSYVAICISYTVECTSLLLPTNGNISCNSTGVTHYEDHCSFSCDPGYQLTGSSSRQCLSNGSWSGSDVTCDILHCDNLTDGIENSVLANDCGSEFGSVCRVECNTGYRAVGNDTFTCVSVNDGVDWRNNVNGGSFQCIGDVDFT